MAQPERTLSREAPAGQWARVIWLDGEIRSGHHPNAPALQDQFDVSRRTAFGTVTVLRDSLGAPPRYSATHRGYGSHVEVLAPAWLRDGAAEEACLSTQARPSPSGLRICG